MTSPQPRRGYLVGQMVWARTAWRKFVPGGKRKDTWIPLALAGAAGLAVLGILMTRMGMSSGGSFGGTKISINGTLFGWWLPLAAAATATTVSVQRILKA